MEKDFFHFIRLISSISKAFKLICYATFSIGEWQKKATLLGIHELVLLNALRMHFFSSL